MSTTPLEEAIIAAHGTGDWVQPQEIVKMLRQSKALPAGTEKAEVHRAIKKLVDKGVLERKVDGAQSMHRFKRGEEGKEAKAKAKANL